MINADVEDKEFTETVNCVKKAWLYLFKISSNNIIKILQDHIQVKYAKQTHFNGC